LWNTLTICVARYLVIQYMQVK